MAPFYSLIKHVQNAGDSKADLVLKLRVVRFYKMPSFDNRNAPSSYELVCHDRSGEHFHASIGRSDYRRLRLDWAVGRFLVVNNNVDVEVLPSQYARSASCVADDVINGRSRLISLNSLWEEKQVGSFWIYGRIDSAPAKGNWFYLPCKRCTKKVSTEGDQIVCGRCQSDEIGDPSYKLIISISDETGDALLVLWNKECVDLIGKTTTELSDACADGNKSGYIPSEITSLVDREVMFKVNVKHEYQYGQPLNVVAINWDSEIISKYGGMSTLSTQSTEPDLLSILASAEFMDESHGSSKHPVYCSPDGSPTTGLTEKKFDTESIKRNLDEQFSSSVNSKKHKAVVEKI